eukprot:784136_1
MAKRLAFATCISFQFYLSSALTYNLCIHQCNHDDFPYVCSKSLCTETLHECTLFGFQPFDSKMECESFANKQSSSSLYCEYLCHHDNGSSYYPEPLCRLPSQVCPLDYNGCEMFGEVQVFSSLEDCYNHPLPYKLCIHQCAHDDFPYVCSRSLCTETIQECTLFGFQPFDSKMECEAFANRQSLSSLYCEYLCAHDNGTSYYPEPLCRLPSQVCPLEHNGCAMFGDAQMFSSLEDCYHQTPYNETVNTHKPVGLISFVLQNILISTRTEIASEKKYIIIVDENTQYIILVTVLVTIVVIGIIVFIWKRYVCVCRTQDKFGCGAWCVPTKEWKENRSKHMPNQFDSTRQSDPTGNVTLTCSALYSHNDSKKR